MKVSNIMLSNRFGGIGQVYIDYQQVLSQRGHAVQPICHRSCVWSEATARQLREHNGQPLRTVTAKGGPLALWSLFRIRSWVRRFSPDIIVIHNYVRLGLLACRDVAPTVAVTHMYKFKHFDKFSGVLALTPELREKCLRAGVQEKRVHLVPNFISGPFPACRPPRRTPPVIGGLGRLDHVKGYPHLIEASRLLRARGLDHRLLLGGNGFQEAELRAQAKAAGLDESRIFLGYVADKAAFFDQIDLFCVPSLQEPFGLTVLEAMKFGKPMVATSVGGPASILTHEQDALLVPPADAPALADALARLLLDPHFAQRLADSAQKTVRTSYSAEIIGEKLETTLAAIARATPMFNP
jgi:glycosyltransferase involved in cell wall biosynthesis